MSTTYSLTYVFFVYGLAFFCMGLVVMLEGNRATDAHLRRALRPLAVFGLVHGGHEWLEMFATLRLLPWQADAAWLWESVRLGLLTLSFVALASSGTFLLAVDAKLQRPALLVPVIMVALWGGGALVMRGIPVLAPDLWDALHVWTRYTLAIPGALFIAAGLVVLQRTFRQAGLIRFGRDSLWAAVAFAWYGVVGQIFAQASPLPPSGILNEGLFLQLFGFPVQIFRAVTAVLAAFFVIRFLRAFEIEHQRQLDELQAARITEAERREAQRGELLGRVVAAQETERQRIARELHDATGQTLTALGLGLRGVETTLRVASETAPPPPPLPEAAHQLRELEHLTASAIDELRRLIADLRPPHLDDLGLPATLRWYAKELHTRAALDVQVEITGHQYPLEPPTKLALFRIAQEALTNVLKHSGARAATVQLEYAGPVVRLSVRDHGRGFDPAAQPNRPAWGVLGMQERVLLLNGQCEVRTAPGQGTEVRVEIPGR